MSGKPSPVPSITQRTCQCGSMIKMVPWFRDVSVLIPVDVDRDPEGSLVVVGSRGGYTIRLLEDVESPAANMRRRAHWDVCPHQIMWNETLVRVGLRSVSVDRSGPCVICWQRHPWRYGGPIAYRRGDRCRAKKGLPLMEEM